MFNENNGPDRPEVEPVAPAEPSSRSRDEAAPDRPDSTMRKLAQLIKSKRSWLTQTKYFQKAIDSSFDAIDVDGSGVVSLEELYAGLLLIHLNMASYVGAPACRPASKEYVTEIFHLLDANNSGTLSKEEFKTVMKILYSQVFTRIVIQWGLTLMIVPVISQYIVKYALLVYGIAHEFWKDIDDGLDPLQRLLWNLHATFLEFAPRWMDAAGGLIRMAFDKFLKGTFQKMPYLLLTLAQTSIFVPYALNWVEGFFEQRARAADGRKAAKGGGIKEE